MWQVTSDFLFLFCFAVGGIVFLVILWWLLVLALTPGLPNCIANAVMKQVNVQVGFQDHEPGHHGSGVRFATLHDLQRMENRIMSAISEFASKQNAFNDRIDSAVTALQGDVQALNDKITELQNSPGVITPEDQALLDQLQSRAESITAKLEALDALTPPKPPVG